MRPSLKAKNRLKNDLETELDALTENTALAYRTGIKQFRAFLKKRRLADNMKSAKTWLKTIYKSKSPSTYNLRARAMRFYFTIRHADDPAKLWEVQFLTSKNTSTMLACHDDGYLKKETVDYLVSNMTKKMGLITYALFWSGCRISELLNIRLRDIKSQKTGQAFSITIVGKGYKVRSVYLPYALAVQIKKVFRGKKYLFESQQGGIFNRSQIATEMSRQGKKADIRIHPHILRHSKAMYMKDVLKLSADQIAKALGHADVSTTLKCYFHGTPSAADQGIE